MGFAQRLLDVSRMGNKEEEKRNYRLYFWVTVSYSVLGGKGCQKLFKETERVLFHDAINYSMQ